MSGLRAADEMLVFLPMDLPDLASDAKLVTRMRANPPDLVLWTEHDLRPDFGFMGFGIDYARISGTWIRDTYVPIAPNVGPVTLLANGVRTRP